MMFARSSNKKIAAFDIDNSNLEFDIQIIRLQTFAKNIQHLIPESSINAPLTKLISEVVTIFNEMSAAITNANLDKVAIREFRGKFNTNHFNKLMSDIVAIFPDKSSKDIASNITQEITGINQKFFSYLRQVEMSTKADSINQFIANHSDEDVVLTAPSRKM